MSKKEIKNQHITLRLTEEEFLPYAQKIKELGLNKSEFFRYVLLNNFSTEMKEKEKDEAYKYLIFYYNKTSNNINQIAKTLNTEALKGQLDNQVLIRAYNKLSAIYESLNFGIEDFKNGKN